jgi:uncharacterized protein
MTTRDDNAAGRFFGLVLILSLPFYALGATGVTLPFAPALPINAVMACVPMIAALILVTRQDGVKAASRLFASAFRFRTIPNIGWALVALGFMPVAFLVTGGIVWLSGIALPDLHLLPASAVIPAFVLFFLGAVGEEIGWQGYAYPALAGRHSALNAALIIGVVWALWHVIPFALMGRSATWILWHGLGIVLMRIIIVWLFVNTGQSPLIAVIFHMMSNSVWGVFPDFAPWYDPRVMTVVLLSAVMAIATLWGPSTLKRSR